MTAFFNMFQGNKQKDAETLEKILPKLSPASQEEVKRFLDGSLAELSNFAKTEASIASLKVGVV
jgi:hypothetical protein